jgi:DNA polymerase-3 subunit alpha
MASKFKQIFGDKYFLEMQWNGIEEQHIYNQMLIKLSKQLSIPMVSTNDCHYPSPDKWKDRELYKSLSRLSKGGNSDSFLALPDSLDDMSYQIYPKNYEQMVEAFEKYSKMYDVEYDRDLILQSSTTHIKLLMK